MEAVTELQNALDDLDALTASFSYESLADMNPQALVDISLAVSSLAWASLRCAGANVKGHPVLKDIERVKLYSRKVREHHSSLNS
jgi:hypothetical protein